MITGGNRCGEIEKSEEPALSSARAAQNDVVFDDVTINNVGLQRFGGNFISILRP